MRRVAVLVAMATLGLAAGITPAGPPPAAEAASLKGGIRTWVPLSEQSGDLGTVSRTTALSIAKSYDLVTAHRDTFKGHVPAMKTANPGLKVLFYSNAMFGQTEMGPPFFPASWYSYDANRQPVRSRAHGNYMMNPRSLPSPTGAFDSWANDRYRHCKVGLDASGYDGCFLDLLGTAPLLSSYVTAKPIDPATGKPWTQSSYLAATSTLAGEIRKLLNANRLSSKVLYGNGLQNGPLYASTKVLLGPLTGGMAESWLRVGPSSLTAWPTEPAWKANVEMLRDGAAKGKPISVVVKTFAPGTQAQRDQWHAFALASFLLGSDGKSGFSFIGSPTQNYTVGHPWWNTVLGAAPGSYVKAGTASIYYRNFASGKAVVNPGTATASLALGAQYCGLTGFKGTTLSLAAHTGEVLRSC